MWTHHDFEEATSHLGQLKLEENKKTRELLLVKFFLQTILIAMMLLDVI